MTQALKILLDMTVCLLLTLSAEGILIFLISKRKKYVYYSVICNVLTNPALNLIMLLCAPALSSRRLLSYGLLALLELAAVITEGLIYRALTRTGLGRCMLLSLILNAVSFLLGVMLLWRP